MYYTIEYIKDIIQVRQLLQGWPLIITTSGILFTFAIYCMITLGRPESDTYWENIDSILGGEINSTVCETIDYSNFARQKYNTLASYAYLFYALLILSLALIDFSATRKYEYKFGNQPASLILRRIIWSVWFSLVLMFNAGVCWLRYASVSQMGENFQVVGEWTLVLSLAVCSIVRLLDPPQKSPSRIQRFRGKVVSYVAVLVVLAFGIAMSVKLEYFQQKGIPSIAFAGLFVLGVLPALVHWRLHVLSIASEWWLVAGAGATFGFGYIFAYLDRRKIFCHPEGFIQLQALSLVLSATSVFLIYLFFRTDMWKDGEGVDLDELINQIGADKENVPESRSRGGSSNTSRSLARTAFSGSFSSQFNPSVAMTPELGFTDAQIRFGEIICGVIVTGFVGAVVYYAFTSDA